MYKKVYIDTPALYAENPDMTVEEIFRYTVQKMNEEFADLGLVFEYTKVRYSSTDYAGIKLPFVSDEQDTNCFFALRSSNGLTTKISSITAMILSAFKNDSQNTNVSSGYTVIPQGSISYSGGGNFDKNVGLSIILNTDYLDSYGFYTLGFASGDESSGPALFISKGVDRVTNEVKNCVLFPYSNYGAYLYLLELEKETAVYEYYMTSSVGHGSSYASMKLFILEEIIFANIKIPKLLYFPGAYVNYYNVIADRSHTVDYPSGVAKKAFSINGENYDVFVGANTRPCMLIESLE